MWKNFLEPSSDDLIAVGKQTQNAFTAEKITFPSRGLANDTTRRAVQ
jgi:hypothetical protein